MTDRFPFTFSNLQKHFARSLECGYEIIPCVDYIERKNNRTNKRIHVNRVDIDVSPKKARRIATIFNKLGIRATFFVRLHANEYNPFSFENYRCLRFIRDSGHEIGYHSEVIDQSSIWSEDAANCLRRDLSVLNAMLDIQVKGVASHGGLTGLNNLDFWNDRKPSDFDLLYEAYDKENAFGLFDSSFYVSDSCWTYWKSYENGILKEEPCKPLGEHFADGHSLVYSLIHPETYYDEHFYE